MWATRADGCGKRVEIQNRSPSKDPCTHMAPVESPAIRRSQQPDSAETVTPKLGPRAAPQHFSKPRAWSPPSPPRHTRHSSCRPCATHKAVLNDPRASSRGHPIHRVSPRDWPLRAMTAHCMPLPHMTRSDPSPNLSAMNPKRSIPASPSSAPSGRQWMRAKDRRQTRNTTQRRRSSLRHVSNLLCQRPTLDVAGSQVSRRRPCHKERARPDPAGERSPGHRDATQPTFDGEHRRRTSVWRCDASEVLPESEICRRLLRAPAQVGAID